MYLQIKEVILWPKKEHLKPKRIKFLRGKVNVISGASRTGKSAIIPIIDYCLGSDKCTIPVQTIRDSCKWFGIVIDTVEGKKLLARREPGSQKSTSDMYILEGNDFHIPEYMEEKNANVETVKRILDETSGLSTLNFDFLDSNNGFKGRTSFRDLISFNFQPQNIIANPDVLFYKADTYEHREKLRTIFPYVLNAVTSDMLAKQHELARLRKLLKRKLNEFKAIAEVSEKWIADIRNRVSEAKELGLVTESISVNSSKEELINIIKKVVDSPNYEASASINTINEAMKEIVDLQNQETHLATRLSILRKRFTEMSKLKDNTIQFKGTLQLQRERLNISRWLVDLHKENHECPICGNEMSETNLQLASFFNSLKRIEKTNEEFVNLPASFDREFEQVKLQIKNMTEKLEAIKLRRKSVEQLSENEKYRQYDSLKVSKFIGILEQSLATYESIGSDGILAGEIKDLESEIEELEYSVSEKTINYKVKKALEQISKNVAELLPDLDVERPEDTVILSISNLTIKVKGTNREDFLWEIGSGSNWLSYHIAITLGLQMYFQKSLHSPVPSFLVYDQPSQVYFPTHLTPKNKESEENSDVIFEDEDVQAVRKVFKVMDSVIEQSKGAVQIIVLDHAPEKVWSNIANVHKIDEWRRNKKLIPDEWLIM
ncbi:DUF3732 domain-containing protein [Priestia aryabhattai]|uniref:DUF3732 domain-containing protein n=1 Tax=Priestia aryabhattai TaxID=412384 RepID=UPI001CD22F78|nr:DUF3732 domain-containing protein [Priestia aryabhattai]MCA1050986.1 DUF3732 domain-containing protein [Priestia aryabhattai]